MNFPVFDLHCDTAFAVWDSVFQTMTSMERNALQFDLERASRLPGYAQCFACFTSDANTLPLCKSPEEIFRLEQTAVFSAFFQHGYKLKQAFTAADILENRQKGFVSGILSIEGPAGFQYDPSALEQLYKLGFRITTLCWNEHGPLAGSHATGGGLTDLGVAYVREAQRLGMLVDVSHISDEAFWDIMKITQKPIIATHSNSRCIHNVSRNLTDEMFLALCRSGGVVGINLFADFLGYHADLDTVCDHILHFLNLNPDGKHICLGGDLDGCDQLPEGFHGVQDYPKLAEQLLCRGLSEAVVYDIFWNNAVALMRQV